MKERIKQPFQAAFNWVMEYYNKTIGQVVKWINNLRDVKDEAVQLEQITATVNAGNGSMIG
ncbi:hypothetical protein [Xenorhabdus anantnagensis]|uniref:Uncharacterized protein n=1 Tax=Xenorhabdus anantnagensis TaxID=3025875 RepID=A0ABT5LSG4_9GAMM|nr:hypothetical protein [Xenorhabdus anantnagensis]MDC9597342.1 hypothetical protein [Xenorhabdus anantnagensis]